MINKEIVVVYPREIKFINKVGGSISYSVDRKVSDYVKQLQSNWNSLREYCEENKYFYSGYQGEDREEDLAIKGVLDKMNELEGKDKE